LLKLCPAVSKLGDLPLIRITL